MATPAKAAAPTASVTGGDVGSVNFGSILQQLASGGAGGPLGLPAAGGSFPNVSTGATAPKTQPQQSSLSATSARYLKGATINVGLTQADAIQTEGDAVAQQLIGRNLTPEQINAIQGVINSQELAKGASDLATAQAVQVAQEQFYSGLYGGGSPGTAGAGGGAPSTGGLGANGRVTGAQVYAEVLRQGGTQEQALVGAALVSGIESNGDPRELAGGIGPAQGLFQFEPGTWTGSAGGGKNGLPATVAGATWQQQVSGFLNATRGNNFGAWGPDLVTNSGNPNSSSNPAYGYSGAPQPGSKVANVIASNAASWHAGAGASGLAGMSASNQKAMQNALSQPGGQEYFAALNAQNQPAAGGSAASGTSVGPSQSYQVGNVVYDVGAPTETTYQTPLTASEGTAAYLMNQDSKQYQEQNLVNVFQTIQQMLGAQSHPSLNPANSAASTI